MYNTPSLTCFKVHVDVFLDFNRHLCTSCILFLCTSCAMCTAYTVYELILTHVLAFSDSNKLVCASCIQYQCTSCTYTPSMNWLLFFNSLFPLGLPCSALLVSSTAVTLDNEICVPWILDLLDLLLPSGLRWKSCYQACWTSNFTPLPYNDPFKCAPCSNPYICIPIPCSYPFFSMRPL